LIVSLFGTCVFALGACGGAQRAGDENHVRPGPYTRAQREDDARTVVRIYERAVRHGRDAYLTLWDFDEVGAVERLLQRYDLYRGDPLGEPEEVRRNAPPEPFSHEREQRNVTNLFPWLGSGPVGAGRCHAREPRSEYARTLITYEPLPPEDQARWGPLRDRVNALFACGGLTGMRCDGGHGAIAIAYARIPCHDGNVTADSRLRVVTVYVDDVQ
jgi:hypothetical protein